MWYVLISTCNGVNIQFICHYVITFSCILTIPPPPSSNCMFINKCHFSILLVIDIPVSPWVPYSIEFTHCGFAKCATFEKCILHSEWVWYSFCKICIVHFPFTGNSHHPWSHALVVISKSTVMHQFAHYVRLNHVAETPRSQRRKTEIFWTQMENVCINDMHF